jgi:hypothetical protein
MGKGEITLCFVTPFFFLLWPFLPAHCRCRGLILHLITLLSDIHTHSVWLLWPRDQPDAGTSTCSTQNTHKRQRSIPRIGIRTHNPSKRAAPDLCLRTHGHWDRLLRHCRCWLGWIIGFTLLSFRVIGKVAALHSNAVSTRLLTNKVLPL